MSCAEGSGKAGILYMHKGALHRWSNVQVGWIEHLDVLVIDILLHRNRGPFH